jgi:hypothetical protein
LFNVGATFSAGYGSEYGKGYVVEIDMVTLTYVPDDVSSKIEIEVLEMIRDRLPKYFPERNLKVRKDGNVIKIFGDLSLGAL